MAELDTGQDILRALLRRAGDILPTGTSETGADRLIDAKIYINEAHWWLCALRPWRWARKVVQVNSTAQVTGTVSTVVTTAVTLSATIATSMAGRRFMIDSDAIPHKISAHTAGTDTLTLETAYTGAATSGAFTIFLDEITVATDILSFPRIKELEFGDDLIIVPEAEFLDITNGRNVYGTTRAAYCTFISDQKIRIAPWTTDAHLFECWYNYSNII